MTAPEKLRRALLALVLAAVGGIPLVVDTRGYDAFRLPKEMAFITFAALLFTGVAIAIAAGMRRDVLAPADAWLFGAIVVWALVAAVFATNRTAALRGFVLVAGMVLFAAVAETLLRQHSRKVLWVLAIPATINGGLFLLQNFAGWQPLYNKSQLEEFAAGSGQKFEAMQRAFAGGLLGNPTDVACLLLVPTLVTFVLGLTSHRFRPLYLAIAVLLAATVIATQLMTGVIALAAGLATIFTLRFPRSASVAAVVALIAVGIGAGIYPPLKQRFAAMRTAISEQRYDAVLSGRLPGFGAGLEMGLERPLVGVGPGCFGANYFEYRLRAEQRFPTLLASEARVVNFGAVHNDFIDVFAETGLPGLLLMLAVLVILARRSLPWHESRAADQRLAFARLLAGPLAVCFSVLALAQFPLSLPAVMTQFVFAAAICRGWTNDVVA